MKIIRFFCCIFLLNATSVFALDLGVQGSTWQIIEEDIRVRMAADAKKVDWENINAGIAKDAKEKLNKFKKYLPAANEYKVSTVDISVQLADDFIVELPTPNGGVEKKVLFHKGYFLNPLDFIKPWQSKKYLIFNANSTQELQLAKKLQQASPAGYIFFTTEAAQEPLDFPVYPVDDWFFATVKVVATPTLVGIANKQPRLLTKAQLVPPFVIDDLKKVFE